MSLNVVIYISNIILAKKLIRENIFLLNCDCWDLLTWVYNLSGSVLKPVRKHVYRLNCTLNSYS